MDFLFSSISFYNKSKKNNAVCAINGDYCGNADKGVVIRNGYLYRTENVNDVCTIYKNGKMKLSTATDYDADAEIMNGAWQAWSFGPSLVSGGKVLSDLDTYGFVSQVNPRTGIGYYEPGHYVFVTVDGRSEESMGMTLYEFANLFKNLGCKEAYNLDGGRSSVMTMGSRIVNVPHEGGRATSDIVYITDSPSEAGGSK